MPALLGALNRNTDRPGGAGALQSALTRDHDGSILDDVAGHFAGRSSGKSADGAGILGHLFGGKQDMIAAGLAKTTGTDSGAMTSMLGKLAPVVMGALGKQQRQGGLDASALSSLLTGERREMEKRDSNAGGLMAKLFDQDGRRHSVSCTIQYSRWNYPLVGRAIAITKLPTCSNQQLT